VIKSNISTLATTGFHSSSTSLFHKSKDNRMEVLSSQSQWRRMSKPEEKTLRKEISKHYKC